jgi:parvulin-like peptidyl-prolyl isomerase
MVPGFPGAARARPQFPPALAAQLHLTAVLLTAALLACSGGARQEGGGPETGGATAGSSQTAPAAMEPQTVVNIGDANIPYTAFERYLADNGAEGDEGGGDEEQDATIKGRLLDQFIEEQLLARAADRFKITVSEAEIDLYLQALGVTEGEAAVAGPEGKDAFRDKVRQSILIQKVKDQAVLSKVEVTPGEIEDYFNKHTEQYRMPRSVVLRQILLDDKSQAERLAADLAKDPAKFEAVARERSISPDRGQARSYNEDDLPVELREPLFALQPGQVSPALEQSQHWIIFQLVRKNDERAADLASVRRTIHLQLFQAKGDQALEQFIADLKKEAKIRVNQPILRFDYAGEYRR